MPIEILSQDLSGGVTVIEFEGDIDFSVSQKVKDELSKNIVGGKNKLILDFSKVRYIDSSGLESVTSTQSKANEAGGDICIICSDPSIKKIFDITGLDEFIRFFNNLSEASAAFIP